MVGTADVVTRDDGDEFGSSICAGGLYTTKCICRDGGCGAVTVASGLHTCVDAGGIGAPELNIGICYWLASRCVDHIDVEVGDSTLLTSKNVLSNEFTSDPCIILVPHSRGWSV
jgi:hypothetical protein